MRHQLLRSALLTEFTPYSDASPPPVAPAPRARPGRLALVRRALREPGKALSVVAALLRGRWVVLACRLRGIRVEAGRNLRVEGKLVIRGPGRVIIGDDVLVCLTVTPWTHAPDAVLRIGSRTFLNGTRFGCAEEITVGEDCILADAQIMDTDFHSTHVDRHDPASPVRTAPVVIGRNVWLAGRVGVLPGTRIGENSVVGFGAVCTGSYPPDMLIAGNPARAIRPVPGSPAALAVAAEAAQSA